MRDQRGVQWAARLSRREAPNATGSRKWAERIARLQPWSELVLDIAVEQRKVHGATDSQGASILSWRSAAMKGWRRLFNRKLNFTKTCQKDCLAFTRMINIPACMPLPVRPG